MHREEMKSINNAENDMFEDVKKDGALIQIQNTSRFFLIFSLFFSLMQIAFLLISDQGKSLILGNLIFSFFVSLLSMLLAKHKKIGFALGLVILSSILLWSYFFIIMHIIKSGDFLMKIMTLVGASNILISFLLIGLFVSSILATKATRVLKKLKGLRSCYEISVYSELKKGWILVWSQIILIGIFFFITTGYPVIRAKLQDMGYFLDEEYFFSSLRNGDIKAVQIYLDKNPITNQKNDKLRTGINELLFCDNIELVNIALRSGVNINTRDDEGKTPLIASSLRNNGEIVKRLLENGADVNAQDGGGKTALFWAIVNDNEMMAILFIKHGADINEKTVEGKTALVQAIMLGEINLAKFLIENGADLTTKYEGYSLLQWAQNFGRHDIADVLKKAGAK